MQLLAVAAAASMTKVTTLWLATTQAAGMVAEAAGMVVPPHLELAAVAAEAVGLVVPSDGAPKTSLGLPPAASARK